MSDSGLGRLTIHALDTSLGRPAEALAFALYALDGAERHLLTSGRTNADGRNAAGPLLVGAELKAGLYELVFEAGAYLAGTGLKAGDLFYDQIPIRFRVGDVTANYHVPLILARYGYTTYRGS